MSVFPSVEGGVVLSFAPLSVDVSAARFRNRGANPFDIDRVRVRGGLDLPAKTKIGLIAEYAHDEYTESSASYAGFDARRVGLFIRYRP